MNSEPLMDRSLRGGIFQYARQPSDLDIAILELRERLAVDFLEPLLLKLRETPSIDLALYIAYMFQVVYPDSISVQQTREYELRHMKEFVPERFVQDIPLFGKASILLHEGLDISWVAHTRTLHTALKDLALTDFSDKLFSDESRKRAAGVVFEYSLERHMYI